jgi:hypothetical protein
MSRWIPAACAACCIAGLAAQTAPMAQEISSRLTANDLKADVSFLASDALQGRGTPSPGLDIAAEFIASQFRRAGLEPADDDGYFQTASYLNVTPNLDGLELTLEIGGKTIKAEKTSMGLQEPVALDLSRAPAIKVSLDDSAALESLTAGQVRGKILILDIPDSSTGGGRGGVFALMRRIPVLAARLQPAVAVVLRSGGQGINAGPRLREVSTSPVPTLLVWDAAVRTALAAPRQGPIDGTLSVHIPPPTATPVKLRNVIGVLRGSDPALKDTYVLLTAHYDHLGVRGSGPGDHIYNGANDDASGTASVIEVAHALAGLPARPKRSIVFVALFGEEIGLVGSRYYAQHPVFPLAGTVADINLEQLGRTDDNTGPRVGLVNVTGYDFTSLTGIFKQAGQPFGIQVLKDEQSSDPFFARSDNQAFADAGIPSHTLSVGYVFPDYHQPGDEWQKIDYDNMAKVDQTVALGMFRIADSPEVPQWNADNPKTERYIKAHEGAGQTTNSRQE